MPGALEAIARLNHAGWHTVVATNQSGLGARPVRHGRAERDARAHEPRAAPSVGGRIDAVFFCPHTPDDGCDCRKPLPGLFEHDRRALRRRPARACRWSATRCATCRPAPRPAARRTWCAPARRAALDDAQLRRAAERRCRHAKVHADLAAFAQQLLQRERDRARRCRPSPTRSSAGCADGARSSPRPLGAVRPVPGSVTVVPVGDRGGGLFDLRPRRARCTGSASAGCAWRSGARA